LRILLIKLHAIGDAVMITPAIRHLKHSLPDAEVDILIGEWSAQVMQHNPYVHRIITFPDRWFSPRNPWNCVQLYSLSRQLRSKHYDAVLVFHHHWAIRTFASSLSAPITLTYHPVFDDSDRFSLWDTHRHGVRNATALVNAFCRRLGVAEIPDDDDSQLTADWVVTDDEAECAKEILAEAGIDQSPIVIHPGAGGSPRGPANERKWFADRFAGLIDELHRQRSEPLVLEGAEFEQPLAEYIQRRLDFPIFSIVGKSNLREMAAILSQSRLLITNDTGTMHIGGAVAVPLVAIFGSTGSSNLIPLGGPFKAVQSTLPCSPCTYGVFKGCLYQEIECMKEITVDRVLQTALDLLRPGSSAWSSISRSGDIT
jgi:heptosyltransferase-2